MFGSQSRTDVLLALAFLEESHGGELATMLPCSLSQIQRALASLELAGIAVSVQRGNQRRYRLNPRYVALPELSALAGALIVHRPDLTERMMAVRRRPRKKGKEL